MAFDVDSLRAFGADRDDDGICRRAADEIERLLDRDKTLREIAQFRIPPSDAAHCDPGGREGRNYVDWSKGQWSGKYRDEYDKPQMMGWVTAYSKGPHSPIDPLPGYGERKGFPT
jgi:hypothetical protein